MHHFVQDIQLRGLAACWHLTAAVEMWYLDRCPRLVDDAVCMVVGTGALGTQ
jgi:hypothetical protein